MQTKAIRTRVDFSERQLTVHSTPNDAASQEAEGDNDAPNMLVWGGPVWLPVRNVQVVLRAVFGHLNVHADRTRLRAISMLQRRGKATHNGLKGKNRDRHDRQADDQAVVPRVGGS